MLPRILLFSCAWAISLAQAGPTVSTRYGEVEGFESVGRDGNVAEVFLAIPYAKPPVGELRFEKPELPEPWTGVYHATQFRNDCTPHMKSATLMSVYSGEDCLTFNVVRPKGSEGKKLPVLFWIHGGGYEVGSASLHGYKSFVDNYVKHDIIVVSIQYRLGFLGFFSDGTSEVTGMQGMFDEAAALKFVYDNIDSFGGDRNEITVWGYSAGAGSVSQLSLSPYSRDYFARSIIMSGSAFAGWATGHQVANHCLALARVVGCHGPHPKECLKTKSIDELMDAVEIIGGTTDNIDIVKFGPTLDGDFIPSHPNELVRDAPVKPTLIGLSRKEGNFFTVLNMLPQIHSFGMSPNDLKTMNESTILNVIQRKLLYDNRFGEKQDLAARKIADHYLSRGRPIDIYSQGNGFFIDRYTEIMSDITFNVPVLREIEKKHEVGTPIWAYMFDYYNDALFNEQVPEAAKGSPHANEYHYLFEIPMIGQIDVNVGEDRQVRDNFIEMVVSFAKDGQPKVQNKPWDPVQNPKNINFMRFTNNVTADVGLFSEAATFWNSMAHEGFDVVDPLSSFPTSSSVISRHFSEEL
ncbi:unnamed protein product [Caenorhabditis auriculariae]|uniref:Carboxylic ester hydrolase n=1 Tax=Caenorhabditis auriculariae TaxID=2777116 RepID=A0A8S1HDR1_9PELO|nr:unnamed protein product [Caenorhabditis auriculariae]